MQMLLRRDRSDELVVEMEPAGGAGFWEATVADARPGDRYAFSVDGRRS